MKNIIKYILLAVFVFMQVQAFAFNNSSNLWKKVTLKEETNWLFFSNKGNSNTVVFKPEFFAEQVIFSVRAEVDNSGCVSTLNNTPVRFYLKNETNVVQNLIGRTAGNGMKLKLESSTNANINGFSGTNDLLTNSATIQPGEELLVTGTFANYDVTIDELLATVEFSLANYDYNSFIQSNTINGSVIQDLTVSAVISRVPSAPGDLTKTLNKWGYFTIASASGLSNIGKYKFYYNNNVVSPNTPIKMQDTQIAIATLDGNGNPVYNYASNLTLQYSVINGACESTKSNLIYSVYTGTVPANPGSIKSSAIKICYGGSVVISNNVLGEFSSGVPDVDVNDYTWEISYDNGESWANAVNSSLTTVSGASAGNLTLTFNNLSSDVNVRRKFRLPSFDTQSYSYSNTVSVSVVNNEIYLPNDWSVYYVRTGETFTIPTATTTYPSIIELKDSNNQVVSNSFTAPNTPGEFIYTYTATATVGPENLNFSTLPCITTRTISIIVYDAASCEFTKKRTFATIAKPWTSGLSGVANPNNAVNGDRAQYATITGGVVLLGIGTVGIDLYFTKPDGSLYTGAELRGKKVVVKLGEQYSGLKLAGGVTITGRLTHSGVTASNVGLVNASSVGSTFGVKGGVLDLLKGDNVFEYSFIPADGLSNGTPVDYNGIRIQLGSLLGVADLATVFYAFIEEEVLIDSTNDPCNDLNNQIVVSPPASLQYPTTQNGFTIVNTNFALNPFVEDIFWGNYTEVLNVASGLSSVVYPYYAVDNDYNSFAIFNTTAGVLNKQFVNVKLRREARPGDKVQLVLGTESVNVLNLSLLNLVDYKVKFYKGDTEVGSITLDRFKVLDLGLLGFTDTQKAIISAPVSGIFDRVQLEQWNTVSVNLGNQLHVYDIRVNPTSTFAGQTDTKVVTSLCATDYIKIQKADFCTDFEVSFAEATFNTNLQLRDELGNPLFDLDGDPIYSISAVTDISNSSLGNPKQVKDNIAYYEVNRLFTEVGNRLLLKIQTKRNGCNYGDPQYLRVRLTNCESAIVNPVINSSANY